MLLDQKASSKSDHQTLTRCDRCILKLLAPHLLEMEFHSLECLQIHQLLQLFQVALTQRSIISLTPDGQVAFITQQAEKLLNHYFPTQNLELLPDSLKRWFKHQISCCTFNDDECEIGHLYTSLHIEKAEKQLVIHFIPDPAKNYYLLLLEEQRLSSFSVESLELLGLTRREAEVLFWIAKDKSNLEISRLLDCCEGTVRKHLENLYKKLGVQTRIGAVMTALKQLGLLKE